MWNPHKIPLSVLYPTRYTPNVVSSNGNRSAPQTQNSQLGLFDQHEYNRSRIADDPEAFVYTMNNILAALT